MDQMRSAVLFFEEESSLPAGGKPLMLESLLERPVLEWACDTLRALGVQRLFVAAPPCLEDAVRRCVPAQMELTVSEQHGELLAFLNTPESVLVLPRPAFPMTEAGPGFAYAAAGYDLQEVWRDKLTNAVSSAHLASGWLPLYGVGTLSEIETHLRARPSAP